MSTKMCGSIIIVGETLLLQKEPTNINDCQAVSVVKSTIVVGHLSACSFSHFLSKACNKVIVEVTGAKINRGAGYDLKYTAYNYRLYGLSGAVDEDC